MSSQSGNLSKLFNAGSIAIIGASNTKGKQGNTVVSFLRRFGYKGKIYPVNPKEAEIEQLPVYASVTDIPGEIDLAILCLPNTVAPTELERCAQKGVTAAVVWSAGFGELGTDRGYELDAQMREICSRTGIRVCGPNSLGIINAKNGLIASFSSALANKEQIPTGRVAFISQSGGTASVIIDDLLGQGFGFNMFVSSGNEIDVTFGDYCLELLEYEGIDVIAGYIEGIRDGEKFIAAGKRARELGKQIILVKGGRSLAAAEAVRSHTGAIAGSEGIYQAAFREAGILQAENTEELMDLVMYLFDPREDPRRLGRRAVVLATGGGAGVQAVDAVDKSKLQVVSMSDETLAAVRELIPGFAGVSKSMLDLTPQMLADLNYSKNFYSVLKTIESDPGVDVILLLLGSQRHAAKTVCETIERYKADSEKPLLITWRAMPETAREMLQVTKTYVFPSVERAIKAVETLAGYSEWEPTTRDKVIIGHEKQDFDWPELNFLNGPVVLTEDIVSSWLQHYGIANAEARLTTDEDDAVKAAGELGYPLVVKVISQGLAHRSKYNLIALDIKDETSLREACRALKTRALERLGADNLGDFGLWVQQFRPLGLELIIGGFRSEPFGNVIVCGIGGYLAEFFQPVYRLLPIDMEEADRMISELVFLKKYPEELDRTALKQTLVAFSNLLMDCPWENFELELNPVKVFPSGKGTLAVDALAVVRK